MNFSRRALLKSGVASSFFSAARPGWGIDLGAKTVFFLLDGLERALPSELISRVIEVFVERGLPVSVAIESFSDAAESEISGSKDFLRLLGEMAQRESGLLELVPVFAATDDRERYFQLREATELRRSIAMSPLGDVAPQPAARVVSVIDRAATSTIDIYALRAAGFRVQIRPNSDGTSEPVTSTSTHVLDWGLLEIRGETRVDVSAHPDPTVERLRELEGDQLLTLSFTNAEGLSDTDLLAACSAWADALQAALWDGRMFFTRPSDYLLQGNPGASKYVALLLDLREGKSEGMSAFVDQLELAGFPFSLLVSGTDQQSGSHDFCHADLGTGTGVGPSCILRGPKTAPDFLETSEVVLLPAGVPNGWTGQRADGRFQIALPELSELAFGSRHGADPMTDQVEVISPRQVETEIQRRALLHQLEEFRKDGRAHFYTLRGFMEQILAPEPALERLWSARRRKLSDPPREEPPDDTEAGHLMEDARLAWTFIEKFTDEQTGLCAGTASTDWTNTQATMWDLASQIFGILSATRLGLFPVGEASQRASRILENLPVDVVGGFRLPPAVFQTDDLKTAKPGFDACDTGRFLIALNAISASGLVTWEQARDALARWDLAAPIRDRHVFSHDGVEWMDDTATHCTPYTRFGFAVWGMDIDTPYPELGGEEPGDSQMRLLHRAAFLGQFGTEPLLLEAVERGQSAESRFLSDILFDAQLGWFEQTGELKCVSEAPLDFAPWFTYQGLRVDRRGEDAWGINTKREAERFRTAEFKARAELISSKSAFLWKAAYPHSYSDRLVELVRRKARINGHGFSVGIFSKTMEPMRGYSDLNTNGVILTAIAKMLHG